MKNKRIFSAGTKYLVFIFAQVACLMMLSSRADGQTNYYFSSSKGDDSRTGIQAQNPATPWRSIDKLNSSFESILPGDSILFKRGDTFYGSIIVSKSGSKDKPIIISSYGGGNKPVITGFTTISSWTLIGNNIYEATIPFNRETVNCVVINGELQPIGRYPKTSATNGGYLNFESHSGDGQITDNQLSGIPDWTGGEIVIRKNHWILDRTLITSHSGTVINFTPVTTFYKLIDRSGYFIQNHPSALTLNGEWCYDKSSKKIKIFYSTKPPEVKVSTIDELLMVSSKNYIKISHLSFEGANVRAVNANSVMSLSMNNCSLNYSGIFAAQFNQMSGDFQFNDNTVSNSLNNGVSISSRDKESFCTVRNNNITYTGMIAGMGRSGDGNYMGVNINSENGALIEYNVIKNTGYVPLNFNGNNILIKNNIIDDYLMVKQDGAGIYTWNGGNPVKEKFNRKIVGNIVSNGIGNAYGTIEGKPGANGIYMDNNVINVEIIDNTVFNVSGKGNHNNSPAFVTIKGNTFFNVGSGFSFVRWVNDGTRPENGGQDITNMNIQNNIFFATSDKQSAGKYSDRGLNFPAASTIKERISSMGIFDNNYYHLPNGLAFSYSYQNDKSGPYVNSPPLSFEDWRSLTGYEKNGKIIPVVSSDRVRFEVNSTKEAKTISLGAEYSDVYGKHYNGSITLQPFSSRILILNQP
jgi:hypothetical protein